MENTFLTGQYRATPPTLSDLDFTQARFSSTGELVVTGTGTVTTTGAITSIIPGTGATNLGKAEDAAHTSGDVGVEMLAVRSDAGGALAGNGDYIPLITDANGNLRVVASGSTVTQYAEDTAHVTGDIGFEMLAVRTDTAASSANTTGDYATVNNDSLGHLWSREGYAAQAEDNTNAVLATASRPLSVSTYSWTSFQNLGANATLNVKATTGNVFSVTCHNTTGVARYFQLHNTATTPAGGAVPAETHLVGANSELQIPSGYFGSNGLNFATGIAFAISTTEATYTAATATDQVTHIKYK